MSEIKSLDIDSMLLGFDKVAQQVDSTPDINSPKPIENPLPDVQKVYAEMIPAPFRQWLNDVAYRMNCPLDYPTVAMISMVGSLIGSRCGIRPKQKDSWHEVPNLWGGIVAPPSSKKSPATGEVLSALKPLEFKASEIFKEEEKSSRVKLELLDRRKKGILRSAEKAESTEMDAIQKQLIDIETEIESCQPSLRRYQVNDVTPEKLADICTENPQGVLVFRDELIGLLKSWEKQGNESARAFFLEAWNGKNGYKIDRVIKGSSFVDTLCVTVFGGIQPDKLQSYISQMAGGENDGLMQRFQLLIYPDAVPYQYIDEYPDGSAKLKAHETIEAIAQASEDDLFSWGAYKSDYSKIPTVQFSHAAQKVFITWLNDINEAINGDDLTPVEKQHFAKYPKLMPCLALIFHFIECASGKPQKQISEENANLAVIWCNYLTTHANRIYNMVDSGAYAAISLSKKISSKKVSDEFTVPDIQRMNWHGLTTNQAIKDAIEILCQENWLFDISEVPKVGRPSARYAVNPLARNWYRRK